MLVKREGDELVIRIPVGKGRMSSTGKMTLFYSSGGFKDTGVDMGGMPLRANITVGVRNK